jgi:hypothetical protein
MALFVSKDIKLSKVSFETNISGFFSASLDYDENGDLGIHFIKDSNYGGDVHRAPGNGEQPEVTSVMLDYFAAAQIANPESNAVKSLAAANDPDDFDNILLGFFSSFQKAGLNMATIVQRSFQKPDIGYGRDDGNFEVFAEALRVSGEYGDAYGINFGLSGLFGVYSAITDINYSDGRASGKILGTRFNPRVKLGGWMFKGELGYQIAWFDEEINSFGFYSKNNIAVESKILGASAEYAIPLGRSLSIIPIIRYNFQESQVVKHGEDLFYDKWSNRKRFHVLDSGAKLQYKVCVVSMCHYFGGYVLGGYDANFGESVNNFGAFAKISVDSDFAWIDLALSREQFKGYDSYGLNAKLRLVF